MESINTQAQVSATEAQSTPGDGIQRTPFEHPASSAQVPLVKELTNEQTTKYNSLHNTCSTWTNAPTISAANAPQSPITEEEQMWLSRDCLLRYLRANNWNVNNAATRLMSTIVWRREFGIGSKLTPEYISVESETGKQWILGYDKEGHPCHYMNPARQNTERTPRQIEHMVFMLERAIALMPPGQEKLALQIDFKGISRSQGSSIQQGKQTVYILQNHYPERLGRAILYSVPWYIWGFLKVILPFVDPVTRAKVSFEGDGEKFVPHEQLQKCHGGDLEFEYDHSIYWPALNKLAEEREKAQFDRWVKGGKRIGEFEAYLKGGQEECLQDTLKDSADGLTEKVEGLQVGDKPAKSVAIA